MKKWQKALVGFFTVVGALYVVLMVVFSLGLGTEASCTVYPVMAVDSPTGKFRDEQAQEICKKDNRLTTWVWLSEGRSIDLGKTKWSVFHAASAQSTAKDAGAYEPLRLQLLWLSDSELQISYPQGTEVMHSERSEYGVKVSYVQMVNYGR